MTAPYIQCMFLYNPGSGIVEFTPTYPAIGKQAPPGGLAAAAGLGGTMQADWIAVGTVSNTVQISSITYGAYNSPGCTITLASPITWASSAPVWLYKKSDGTQVLYGTAPDYGASEYNPAPPTIGISGNVKIQGSIVHQ